MTKIKFCGLQQQKDVLKAIELSADFIGFIFYYKSPRYIRIEEAQRLANLAKGTTTKVVGVFVNETIEIVSQIYEYVGLDIVQLHGDESPKYASQINKPYWKTFGIKDRFVYNRINEYSSADKFLFDNATKDQYGGTGRAFDWELLKKLAIPNDLPFILAGGISADNVRDALKFNPYAVDINSGVELSAGVKDHKLMEKIVKIVRTKHE